MQKRSKNTEKIKVVLDTSVLIAGLLSDKGASAELIRKVISSDVINIISPKIIDEFVSVLNRPKFNLEKELIDCYIHMIIESSVLFNPSIEKLNVCRDESDNKFIICALQSLADYIVSLDNDLTDLENYKGIKIVRPSELV